MSAPTPTSRLRFRNVDVDPDEPVAGWPHEAIHTALERGTLADWRRIAAEIRRSPWGPVARTVEGIVAWGELYGVDPLMAAVMERARAEVTMAGRRRFADHLRAQREHSGLTLRELAALAGTSASRLSAYENARVSPTTDVVARLEHAAAVARPGVGTGADP